MPEHRCEVLIVGGSLGAVAAALSAVRLGRRTILVSEHQWLGGQATSQGVPPDEHPWIESTGCTASYREWRNRIRAYYRRVFPLHARWAMEPQMNPGGGSVSPMCHLPAVSAAVIEEMLMPYRVSGRLEILRGHTPTAVVMDGDRAKAVDFGGFTVIANYVVDSTETGDLLPLSGAEYVVGAESHAMTSEPHAADSYQPLNQQAITWCCAIGWNPRNAGIIDRPATYDFWKTHVPNGWPGPHLSWTAVNPITLKPSIGSLFGDSEPGTMTVGGRWAFRRIVRPDLFAAPELGSDVTLVNWPQIDYWGGPVVDSPDDPALHLRSARELTLSFVHWLQTESPRKNGGYGYPEIELRGDLFESNDGLARAPYIRESRRMVCERTVTENDIGVTARDQLTGAEWFNDSVGLASYRIDLHPSTGGDPYIDIESWPTQIPLGMLIPRRIENLLPGGKNAGATHITNGLFRVHPSEWNIGEAAGALAGFCLAHDTIPRAVRNTEALLADFQRLLHTTLGFELDWPAPIRYTPRYSPQLHWAVRDKRNDWRM